jgi:hypothetical protein
MPNPREMITKGERRFPVRIRLCIPPSGLGQRYSHMTAWLDENCGTDSGPGTRGVLNDAISSISPMPRSPAPLSLGGAWGQGSTRPAECSGARRRPGAAG